MNKSLTIIDQRQVLGRDFKIYGSLENPLFLAKEVAKWIEHSNVSKMISDAELGENEVIKHTIGTLTNSYTALFLTEDGLYEVLMQSRKPIAKQFKRQVKVILKEIRQTGSYQLQPVKPTLRTYRGVAVVTVKDLAQYTKIATQAIIYTLKKYSIEGKDYKLLKHDELLEFKKENPSFPIMVGNLIIVYESGFKKLCKHYKKVNNGLFLPTKVPVSDVTVTDKSTVEKEVAQIKECLEQIEGYMAYLTKTIEIYRGLRICDDKTASVRMMIRASLNLYVDVTNLKNIYDSVSSKVKDKVVEEVLC